MIVLIGEELTVITRKSNSRVVEIRRDIRMYSLGRKSRTPSIMV